MKKYAWSVGRDGREGVVLMLVHLVRWRNGA